MILSVIDLIEHFCTSELNIKNDQNDFNFGDFIELSGGLHFLD